MRRDINQNSPKRDDRRFPPYWLRRLNLVKAEFKSTVWPVSAEEGLYQVLALSGRGWAQLMSSLKMENPKASARQLEDIAHRLLRRWDKARKTMKPNRGNPKA